MDLEMILLQCASGISGVAVKTEECIMERLPYPEKNMDLEMILLQHSSRISGSLAVRAEECITNGFLT